jgi:hypothetical protein
MTGKKLLEGLRKSFAKLQNDFDKRIGHVRCNGFCGEYECKENQANCKRKAQEK